MSFNNNYNYGGIIKRAKNSWLLDVTDIDCKMWEHQINSGLATFIKCKGPRKKLYAVKHSDVIVNVGYLPSVGRVVKFYSVEGRKRVKKRDRIWEAI